MLRADISLVLGPSIRELCPSALVLTAVLTAGHPITSSYRYGTCTCTMYELEQLARFQALWDRVYYKGVGAPNGDCRLTRRLELENTRMMPAGLKRYSVLFP